jgi:hypothetical protein
MNPNRGGRTTPAGKDSKAMKMNADISLNDRERQMMKVFNIIAGEFNGVDESIINECVLNYSGVLDASNDIVVSGVYEDVARRIGFSNHV